MVGDLKISTRLVALTSVLVLLMVVLGGLGLWAASRTSAGLKTVYEDRTVPMGQLAAIDRLLVQNRLLITDSLVDRTPQVVAEAVKEIEGNIDRINEIWGRYMATALTPEEERLAHKFAEDRRRFERDGLLPALAALKAGDFDAASRLRAEKLLPTLAPARDGVDALKQLQLDVAAEEYGAAVQRYNASRNLTAGLIAVGALFAALLGWQLSRGIRRALAQATTVAGAVAQGDLTRPVQARGRDEVGELLQALAVMQRSLIGVVGNVRRTSDAVANAAAEIAQGNQDLSARTERQASALEETAASMEELGTAVSRNAENAHLANQLAQNASAVAGRGGEVVAQVVDTMKGIDDSARRIADIIGVINGIAFQTNILALNAAVEAARAGEAGRGFAVVAGEVRSLAQRSAEAAKQIKDLITDSVDRVDRGSALVKEAGKTMEDVVASIRRVTDLMGQISADTTHQSAGVAQVGEALRQLDQATQQNAALVEEMAAASAGLNGLARQLLTAVEVFKLAPEAGAGENAQPMPLLGAPIDDAIRT